MQAIKPTNEPGRELLGYVAARLESLRAKLESATLPYEETQVVRGRIAELKSLQKEVNNGDGQ